MHSVLMASGYLFTNTLAIYSGQYLEKIIRNLLHGIYLYLEKSVLLLHFVAAAKI